MNIGGVSKRSQGEIFGIALMFVVIIIGVLVYGKYAMLDGNDDVDILQEGEYKILAEGALNTILKMDIGCEVERGRDSVKDLINFCLENEYSGIDPEVKCEDGRFLSCEHAVNILNDTLFEVFNSTKGIGMIPFELSLDIPANSRSLLFNQSFTNFGSFKLGNRVVTSDNYRKLGYKRAPSGLISWSSSQRGVEFELYLYYR